MEEALDNDNYDDDTYNQNEGTEDNDTYIYKGAVYTNHHAIPRSNDKTLRPDLEKLGLPVNIINAADDVYQNMSVGTKRGKRRKMLLFYCIFTAYNRENIPIDPFTLAKTCGLDRSGISKALSMCSPVNSSSSTLFRYTPVNYIPVYYNKLKEWVTFPETAENDIMAMTEEILTKDPNLADEKPQTVAAAILVSYLYLNGISIDKEKYNSIFGRSDMTINKIKKRIMKAYNE